MKNLVVLIKNNLRMMILKNPLNTALLVILPIIILLIMSQLLKFTDSGLRIAVIDNSKTISSNYVQQGIKDIDGFTIKEMSENEYNDAFINNEIFAALVIDKDFEDKILEGNIDGIRVIGRSGENIAENIKMVLVPEVNNLINISQINNNDKKAYQEFIQNIQPSEVKVIDKNIKDLTEDYTYSQIFIGFFVMFILFRALSGAELITNDRREKVYTRLMSTPVKEWQYYLANIISTLLAIEFQIIASLFILKFLNPIEMGMSNLDIFIVLSVVAILAVSIGIFCLTIVRSRDLSNMISNIVVMALLFLGGCFVPVKMFPEIASKISYLTPIRWVMKSIEELQMGSSIMEVFKYLSITLGFAVVFFLVSIYSIKFRDKVNEG